MPPTRPARRSTSPRDVAAPIRRTDPRTFNNISSSSSSETTTTAATSATPPTTTPLFPPAAHDSPRRPSHHKKRPASHIPRPPNAFILFRANFIRDRRVNVPSTGPLSNVSPTTLSTIVGMTWRSLPEAEREVWVEKARIAREEHKLQYPSYRYQPAPTPDEKAKEKAGKRKIKEGTIPPADVERCKHISNLLVGGLKGDSLEAAIRRFDACRETLGPKVEDDEAGTNATIHAPSTSSASASRSNSLPSSPRRATTKAKATRRTRSYTPRRAYSESELAAVEEHIDESTSPESIGMYGEGVYSDSSPDIASLPLPTTLRQPHQPHPQHQPHTQYENISELTYDTPLSLDTDPSYMPSSSSATGGYMVHSPSQIGFDALSVGTAGSHAYTNSHATPRMAHVHGPSPLSLSSFPSLSGFSSLSGWDEEQGHGHELGHGHDVAHGDGYENSMVGGMGGGYESSGYAHAYSSSGSSSTMSPPSARYSLPHSNESTPTVRITPSRRSTTSSITSTSSTTSSGDSEGTVTAMVTVADAGAGTPIVPPVNGFELYNTFKTLERPFDPYPSSSSSPPASGAGLVVSPPPPALSPSHSTHSTQSSSSSSSLSTTGAPVHNEHQSGHMNGYGWSVDDMNMGMGMVPMYAPLPSHTLSHHPLAHSHSLPHSLPYIGEGRGYGHGHVVHHQPQQYTGYAYH